MTTFDLAEQLAIPETTIIKYVGENIDLDWSTVTPVKYLNTFDLNDFQAEKVLYHFTIDNEA